MVVSDATRRRLAQLMNMCATRTEPPKSFSLIQKCKDKNEVTIRTRRYSMSSMEKARKNIRGDWHISQYGMNKFRNIDHDHDDDEKKSANNNKNDDKKSSKLEYTIQKTKFILNNRYKPKRIIESSKHTRDYYILCQAIDRKNDDKKVIVKKYNGLFDNIDESKTILREIKMLMHFDHPDVKCTYIFRLLFYYYTNIITFC